MYLSQSQSHASAKPRHVSVCVLTSQVVHNKYTHAHAHTRTHYALTGTESGTAAVNLQ